jgi:predicted dehydrogenase
MDGEAFMIQTHPQWLRVVELVRSGRIGQLRSAVGTFSYFKLDTDNIRNIRKYGGGALMDIGSTPSNVRAWFSAKSPRAFPRRSCAARAWTTSTC